MTHKNEGEIAVRWAYEEEGIFLFLNSPDFCRESALVDYVVNRA